MTALTPPRELAELPLYEKVGWNPHDGQRRVIAARVRHRVLAAGRRFGKSEIGGHKLFQEALNTRLVKTRLDELGKRREFWVVGPSYTDAEKEFRILWNELSRAGARDYFDRPGSYNNPDSGQMVLSMWGGRYVVHAKSERHPESLVGEGLSGVVLAEAAKLKESTWSKLIRPTLADYGGWALMTSTPEGKNWYYDLWQRGQDPSRPDWWSMRAPSWMNPYVYPGGASDAAISQLRDALARGDRVDAALFDRLGVDHEIGELVADLTEETFNQEIAALFTEFAGRVFKEFDEEIHVGNYPLQPGWTLYAASDAGFTNPAVWLLLQVDPHEEQVQVLGEVYEPGLTPVEFADLVAAKGLAPSGVRALYPDPADPGFARTLADRLHVPVAGGTGGELRDRLDLIRNALRERNTHLPPDHPDRKPGLVFDRSCTRTIADFLNYRYPTRRTQLDRNAPENPLKKDDHGPEALGRFYAGHYGKAAQRGRARVRNSTLVA